MIQPRFFIISCVTSVFKTTQDAVADVLTLLWTDGDWHLPCDYRLYDKLTDHKNKNDHFQDLLRVAQDGAGYAARMCCKC